MRPVAAIAQLPLSINFGYVLSLNNSKIEAGRHELMEWYLRRLLYLALRLIIKCIRPQYSDGAVRLLVFSIQRKVVVSTDIRSWFLHVWDSESLLTFLLFFRPACGHLQQPKRTQAGHIRKHSCGCTVPHLTCTPILLVCQI